MSYLLQEVHADCGHHFKEAVVMLSGPKTVPLLMLRIATQTSKAFVTTKWKDEVHDHTVHQIQIGKEKFFTLDGAIKDAQIMSLIR
ncbi:hypothetical protein KIN20_033399 [Parelaphostrongylus tenuis]|uniref:Uncharacterized protein n=1 Tax=Parelaphostrongylus tenuis TaxID=148309 RepID=A0AAD5R8C8_PARTN|nr:hypothetical protein KIN20_033399 [Parelaphostrongylus tenuis]